MGDVIKFPVDKEFAAANAWRDVAATCRRIADGLRDLPPLGPATAARNGEDAILPEVATLTFEECESVMRALRRVPFSIGGEPLYNALAPLWISTITHMESLDAQRFKVAYRKAKHCRPEHPKSGRPKS